MAYHTLHSRLPIIEHNVIHWSTRRTKLRNTYRRHDPRVILINRYDLSSTNTLKIYMYTIYSSNKSQERSDGATIRSKLPSNTKLSTTFRSTGSRNRHSPMTHYTSNIMHPTKNTLNTWHLAAPEVQHTNIRHGRPYTKPRTLANTHLGPHALTHIYNITRQQHLTQS